MTKESIEFSIDVDKLVHGLEQILDGVVKEKTNGE